MSRISQSYVTGLETYINELLNQVSTLKVELREICAAIDDPACDLTLTTVECIKKLKAENEWQPISTAPKDGTVVIVWWWNKVITAWCAGAGLSRDGGDWWRSHAMEVVSTDYPRPTHWMPLPNHQLCRKEKSNV